MTIEHIHNWVNGEACAAYDGQWIENVNPANGDVINLMPRSSEQDAFDAVAAAHDCYLRGGLGNAGAGGLTVSQRSELLMAVADAMSDRLEEIAHAESLDSGKPFLNALNGDVPRAIDNLRFYAKAVVSQTTPSVAATNSINYVLRQPLGAVSLITPWNFPIHLLTWKVGPAIAMGNSVIAKPSELTPTTASILGQLFAEVGAPEALFNVMHGYGNEVGDALVRHPHVKAISFTGGTATGKTIASVAAPLLKKTSFELGGKNPSVVFADCDLPQTIATVARAAFFNSGQVCLCGSRVLVEASLFDDFVDALAEQALLYRDQIGPLISTQHRQKVKSYVELAMQEGGEVVAGGSSFGDEAGAYFEPTVIVNLDHECRTVQEEIFGPIVTVHPFDDDDHALELANDSEFGLAASVFTSNLQRAHHFAERIQSGMVWVNDWNLRDLRVPFGGVKQSGVGREGGEYSLNFFSQDRNICVRYDYD
ncbi:MAG: aldehyde dehydrogenase [Planctomycetota bacterium]|jgi:aminomuconate-semialdehyde/2-hydroxymuconate-6-semialdehyde dehydrogenase|nr:aldehyde dehydrogenase [Planctomycetota bacterium]